MPTLLQIIFFKTCINLTPTTAGESLFDCYQFNYTVPLLLAGDFNFGLDFGQYVNIGARQLLHQLIFMLISQCDRLQIEDTCEHQPLSQC